MILGVKQIKINVAEVTIGMFVSGLDRPWTQTPFPIQGFYVHDIDQTKQLKTHCNHVYVDVTKGAAPATANLASLDPKQKSRDSNHRVKQPSSSSLLPLKVNSTTYTKQESLEKEARRARQLHQLVFGAVGKVMVQVGSGNVTSVHETKRVAGSMVDSILRNPDAFTWLSRIRDTDEHTYGHAVRSAVWAILLGRHIGLAKSELDTLALAVLLKDVGKTHIRRELLLDDDRTTQEQAEFEGFIDKSVEILKKISGVEPRVVAIVKTHCERINGSGFPRHLKGDNIPLLGKIAGIVTFYDEVANPRGVSNPIAPSQAVSHLYESRGLEFQEDLVVEFIRAIGLYPTGTLVELTTGQVGIVIEQNFERRLKPKVMLLLNEFKQPLKKRKLLDLAKDDLIKQALVDSGKKRLNEVEKIEIAQDLEPGSYDIDINEIRDTYLLKSFKQNLLSFFKL
jgi:HD-GYP domain-containing protein (c-di-GMP phosphodiesterase class II)